MKSNSSLTIREMSSLIDDWCPIQVFINGNEVWNDEDGLAAYREYVGQCVNIIKSIKFEIVQFHHSIVYIEI